jgi:hypothetical protein
LHALPLAHVTPRPATRHAGTLLEHGKKVGHLRTPDQKVENRPFSTLKRHTLTQATCEHFQVLPLCRFKQAHPVCPPYTARSSYFIFLGPFRNCIYAGKRQPICPGDEVWGKGRERKGGRGRRMIDWWSYDGVLAPNRHDLP